MSFANGLKSGAANDIIVDRQRVALVTFNRPAKRNAIRLDMWQSLAEIFVDLGADPTVRVVILTGNECFSAGADISEFATKRSTAEQTERYEAAVTEALSAIYHLSCPTIAAVHGYCIGGGMAIAQACDFRIADITATFAVPAAKLGIVYSVEECRQLASIVGIANAKRILLSAERFDARYAADIGLAELCDDDQAITAAQRLAARLAENAPMSVSGIKFILNSLADGTTEADFHEINARVKSARSSDDYRQAVEAFDEVKRGAFGITELLLQQRK